MLRSLYRKRLWKKRKRFPFLRHLRLKKVRKKYPSRVNNDEAFNDLMNDVESLREEITESEVFAEKDERSVEDKSDQERAESKPISFVRSPNGQRD